MLKSVSKLRLLVDEARDAYLRGDVNYIIELDGIAERIEQEVSERYMELPVDADGEAIHVGDVMEWPITGETFEVVGVGDGTLFYIEDDGEYADWTGATTKRHHHALTVEDVLRQIIASANNGMHVHGALDTEQIVAEYAGKLKLASDK